MHNKCECNQTNSISERQDSPPNTAAPMVPMSYPISSSHLPIKQQENMQNLYKEIRPLVHRSEDAQQSMLHHFAAVVTSSLALSEKAHGDIPLNKVVTPSAKPLSSCCSTKRSTETTDDETINGNNSASTCCAQPPSIKIPTIELKPCCTNTRPCASGTHKHPENRDRVVLVTCRCGDDCACPGCDVHPSKVMKGQKDPYAGYTPSSVIGEATVIHRRPSIDSDDSQDWKSPTAVFNEHGVMLCGCGCNRPFDSCRGC